MMTNFNDFLSPLLEISGKSAKIDQIRKMIQQVSTSEINVIITGESGTGKEIAARCLHNQSKRKDKPFVPVNCGAIPTDLLESELFGHEKGAFTGAISSRIGRFELANGGTIFLDEIGDMPLPMQVKLLRVIQEKVFERVGSNKSTKVDVRIIAATHRNLEDEIAKGTFREDLFYRLNVFPIEMPSLKSRVEDLPIIISDLLIRFKAEYGANIKITEDAIETLKKCDWNGNIRELSNLIERLIVLYPNQIIDIAHLPEKYRSSTNSIDDPVGLKNSLLTETVMVRSTMQDQKVNLKDMLSEIELSYIKEALDNSNGIVSHAAEQLGMRRTTLVEKMKKYNINK